MYEYIDFFGVKTGCKIVESYFEYILTQFFRVVCIVSQCLRISDHNEYTLKGRVVLQLNTSA